MRRVERLAHEAGVAAIAADHVHRKFELFRDRLGEEGAGHREGVRDKTRWHAVIDDVEEADVSARGAEFGCDARQSRVGLDGGEVYDRDVFGQSGLRCIIDALGSRRPAERGG